MTEHYALVALRLAVVAVGAILALRAFRMAQRSPDERVSLYLLSLGFGLVALASIIEGVLFEFMGLSLVDAHTVEAVTSAFGFAVVLAAIVKRRS
jgi:hypothetical protein